VNYKNKYMLYQVGYTNFFPEITAEKAHQLTDIAAKKQQITPYSNKVCTNNYSEKR